MIPTPNMIDIETNLTRVTREMARSAVTHDLYEGQRNVREWHARLLAELMRAGKYRRGSKVEFCEHEGRLYCVDGQHSLNAIVISGIPQDMLLVVRRVSSYDEIGKVYGTFGRELPRSPADVFNGLGLVKQLAFRPEQLNSLNAALKLVEVGFRKLSVWNEVRLSRDAQYMADKIRDQWAAEARLFFDTTTLATSDLSRRLRNGSVVAVALATLDHRNPIEVQTKSLKFWEEVAKNDGLRRGSPAKALAEWLMVKASSVANQLDKCRFIACAWNAFFDERALEVLRPVSPGMTGITIRGTTYKATVRRTGGGGVEEQEELPLAAAADEP